MPSPHLHLLPGLHGTSELFAPLLEAGAGWPLSACDYPSDLPQTDEAILRAIAASAPSQPYVLVAESFSGPFAIRFAAQRPDHLRGLVLVNTFLRVPLRPAATCIAAVPLRPPWRVVRPLLLNGVDDPKLGAACGAVVSNLSSSVIASRLRLLTRADARPAARAVAIPSLVLRGSRDRLIRAACSKAIASHIPACAQATIPGPHMLLQSHPHECLAAIQRWAGERGVHTLDDG